MVILHNPESGADIDNEFLTLAAGSSIEVTESVARQAQKRWAFLSISEVVETIEEVEEPKEDLSELNVSDLRKKAREVGVKYTGLAKKELVKKLRRKV